MDWKIAVEIDFRKVLIATGMALSTWVACKTGMGDALIVILPAGFGCLMSKEL